ncbi:MAG TPA: TMEM175 family protein [Polyangiaceae bacterium]|nr:TMEM175 family protein [Polyangiaceae bacterium]
MTKNRLEAFSDGVIAIIITIMVLELKVPHGDTLAALEPLLPVFESYVLSFVYVAIYWNNHHHLIHAVTNVTGAVLWANMNLLFWLSLFPFATGWVGENHFASSGLALYGVVLLGAACAYYLLVRVLIRAHGKDSKFARAVGGDFKGKISLVFYLVGIGTAFFSRWVSELSYVLVALLWLVPDRRFERMRE